MQPSRESARYFLEGFVDSEPQEESDQQSLGSNDNEPSKFKTSEDYFNEGPSPAKVEEVKDHLIETSRAKKTASTPYT